MEDREKQIAAAEAFVSAFVCKRLRARMLYEFSRERDKAFSRLAHQAWQVLVPETVWQKSEKITPEEVRTALAGDGKEGEVWLLTPDLAAFLPLSEAVSRSMDEASPSVILAGPRAFVKEEQVFGAPLKVILKKSGI